LGGDPPPGGGSCADIGLSVEGNPFHGWPVNYRKGNWNTISAWYCDPNYFEGYTHWGIDIARLNWDESIHGVEAVVTADDVRVLRATQNGKANSGMGNNVVLVALNCVRVCESTGKDLNADGTIDPDTCDRQCTELDWKAYYFHLMDVTVSEGDELERGDVIGHVNSTGNSTGDHLHYQLEGPEGAVDPAPTMAGDYEDVLRDTGRGNR
jgi:murein DD-endopeptidase MepM/ murein hydrolase activator NlpD